jgi:hypothetical protein
MPERVCLDRQKNVILHWQRNALSPSAASTRQQVSSLSWWPTICHSQPTNNPTLLSGIIALTLLYVYADFIILTDTTNHYLVMFVRLIKSSVATNFFYNTTTQLHGPVIREEV